MLRNLFNAASDYATNGYNAGVQTAQNAYDAAGTALREGDVLQALSLSTAGSLGFFGDCLTGGYASQWGNDLANFVEDERKKADEKARAEAAAKADLVASFTTDPVSRPTAIADTLYNQIGLGSDNKISAHLSNMKYDDCQKALSSAAASAIDDMFKNNGVDFYEFVKTTDFTDCPRARDAIKTLNLDMYKDADISTWNTMPVIALAHPTVMTINAMSGKFTEPIDFAKGYNEFVNAFAADIGATLTDTFDTEKMALAHENFEKIEEITHNLFATGVAAAAVDSNSIVDLFSGGGNLISDSIEDLGGSAISNMMIGAGAALAGINAANHHSVMPPSCSCEHDADAPVQNSNPSTADLFTQGSSLRDSFKSSTVYAIAADMGVVDQVERTDDKFDDHLKTSYPLTAEYLESEDFTTRLENIRKMESYAPTSAVAEAKRVLAEDVYDKAVEDSHNMFINGISELDADGVASRVRDEFKNTMLGASDEDLRTFVDDKFLVMYPSAYELSQNEGFMSAFESSNPSDLEFARKVFATAISDDAYNMAYSKIGDMKNHHLIAYTEELFAHDSIDMIKDHINEKFGISSDNYDKKLDKKMDREAVIADIDAAFVEAESGIDFGF